MTAPRTHERFDELDAILDEVDSRRDTIKRLGALGLALASAGALSAPAAAGRGRTKDRRKKDRDQGKEPDRSRGAGPSGEPDDPNPGRGVSTRDGARAMLTIPDPRITNPRLSISAPDHGVVTATVTATIYFEDIHVSLMQQGVRYAVMCKVMEDDAGDLPADPADHCFYYRTGGENNSPPVIIRFPPIPTNPDRTASLRFSDQFSTTLLNQDVPTRFDHGGRDELYGVLMLFGSTDGGFAYQHVADTPTNQVNRFF